MHGEDRSRQWMPSRHLFAAFVFPWPLPIAAGSHCSRTASQALHHHLPAAHDIPLSLRQAVFRRDERREQSRFEAAGDSRKRRILVTRKASLFFFYFLILK